MIRPIQHIPIGHSHGDARNRRIHPDYLERGANAINDKIQLAWDRGFRRCNLHNIYGALLGEDMQFDAYWEMRRMNDDGRFDRMLDSSDMAAMLRQWHDKGMEVSCYLGTPRKDKKFSTPEPGWADNLWYYTYMCLRMPLDGGCSLGLDVAADANPGDLIYGVMMMLMGLGVPHYVEPFPPVTNKHVHAPVIANYRFWKSRMVEPGRDSKYRYTHETNIIIRGDTPQQHRERFDEVVAHGFNPAIFTTLDAGVSRDGTILELEVA